MLSFNQFVMNVFFYIAIVIVISEHVNIFSIWLKPSLCLFQLVRVSGVAK